MMEFLPLCDVLFNVISLAGYFCDVVFDVVLGYALLERGKFNYFVAVVVLVSISLIVSQIVSLRWYMNKSKIRNENGSNQNSIDKKKPNEQLAVETADGSIPSPTSTTKLGRYTVIALHFTQLGVLWRYAKLFVPVDLRNVKHEVRDLCMLRLVHAFCEAAPMLLLQLHVLITLQNENTLNTLKLKTLGSGGHLSASTLIQQTAVTQQQQKTFKDLNIVSAILSLFSVCWALASFSKNVRGKNVHRLVLTWLGVIFQFLWRLGTIISRFTALTVYASVYSHFVFLVIILHWISMFLWLISPKNVFHGERISRLKKTVLGGMIAFVYIFAYINLQEVNHRQKMLTFYIVMFMENCLLVCLWMVGIWIDKPDGWYWIPILVLSSFAAGMFFMLLYYRYFHVRRLGYEAGGRLPIGDKNEKCCNCIDICKCPMETLENVRIGCRNHNSLDPSKYPHAIPGVFNCRFSNPVNCATKRKKKKPTSFVPPPSVQQQSAADLKQQQHMLSANSGPMSIPFWRRPLPRSHTGGSSENENSSVGSRVNIQQKLQEKKQKQLAELKIIEEEIKQGKLGGPQATGTLSSGDDAGNTKSLPRQPIPRVKKHIDIEPLEWRTPSPDDKSYNDFNMLLSSNLDEVNNLNKFSNQNYDPIYNSFGLNGINISALAKFSHEIKNNIGLIESNNPNNGGGGGGNLSSNNRNMSPSTSQISATESNSLTRQFGNVQGQQPRTHNAKIPHNIPRNPFAENYRGNFVNLYAEAAANSNNVPRNATNSPSRAVISGANPGVANKIDRIYLDVNHPRQISGTYSSIENSGINSENLPFPYNVVPPPRSKLDSRIIIQQQQCNQMNNVNNSKFVLSQRQQMQRAKTPEILLAPHYLENSRIYYDWVAARDPIFRGQDGIDRNQTVSSGDENLDVSAGDDNQMQRAPSDIDSQVSLPRSYTLPREFKYYRRNKGRKVIKNEHFIASTNSSDGDVDSCDDNESEQQSNLSNNSQQRQQRQQINSTPTSNLLRATNNLNNFNNMTNNNATIILNSNNSNNNNLRSNNNNIRVTNNVHYNLLANNSNVNNLDLISGVDGNLLNNTNNNNNNNVNGNNRPMRIRMYGNKGGMMVRHETKL